MRRGIIDFISNKKNKKGQMKLSFGMIFSIILIIAFLAFTIWAIQKFLGIQRGVQVGKFADKLQDDVDKMWRGSQGSELEEYNLPDRIEQVCFADFNLPAKGRFGEVYDELKTVYFGTENMAFYPVGSAEGLDSKLIAHIDINKTTSENNPMCFANADGDVKIRIKMSPGDALVTLSR